MTDASAAPGRIGGCALASRNYLAFGKVIAESWLEHHPGTTFTLVIIDDDPASVDWRYEGVEIVGPHDLGLDDAEIRRMAAMYSPVEFATALKPWTMRHVLERAEVAVYFDGDIEVLAPMHAVAPLALEGVVLTPHSLTPLPVDGRPPDAFTILHAGIYNAGFLAVSANDGGFLDWWCRVLARDCITEPDQGLHADQRWLDFVPSYFPHVILRDPTCNVAYWNLHERPVGWSGDRLELDGRPVKFFHYSGFSPESGWKLSQFLGSAPRFTLAESPAVARACRRWIRRLEEAGRPADREIPYRYAATAGGIVLDRHARRAYRAALLAAEAGGGEEPPNPFDPDGGAAFDAWLFETGPERPLSRYARHIWDQSPPMQALYPDVEGTDRPRWRAWLAYNGSAGAGVPPSTLARIGLDRAPEPFPEAEEDPLPDEPQTTGEPDRSAEPIPQIDEAWQLLQQPFADGSGTRLGPPGRAVHQVVNRLQHERDARTVELGLKLVAAIDELRQRVAHLGPRVEQALEVELPTHSIRLSLLDEAQVGADKARAELAATTEQKLTDLAARLEDQADRIGGALEQDTITANVLSDTEQRLHREIEALRRRLAELEAAASTDGPA